MRDDVVIEVERVSKKFCKNLKDSMVYGMADIGRNLAGQSSRSDQLRRNEFWAVNDVSFEVKKGETLGIIGPNGSGKTTMLKMLNGIFWPDKGKISIRGKIGALIAVGAGFHPQLSGRENIYINGAILGMGRKEIENKFDAIVDFADIGDFLDAPVKHYSSGMHVRLGFAIAVHSQVDILLIDEVLSVGDINFQAKCVEKIKDLDKRGVTKIFISHNLNSVQLLCQKALYLSKGDMKYYGDTRDVINEFKKTAILEKGRAASAKEVRYGTQDVTITRVEFLDKNGNPKEIFKRGESLSVRISYCAQKEVENPDIAVGFHAENGQLISLPTTKDHNIATYVPRGDGRAVYRIDSLPFNIGRYSVSVSIWDSTGKIPYDHHAKLYEFIVEDGPIGDGIHERFGLLYIPARWSINGGLKDKRKE